MSESEHRLIIQSIIPTTGPWLATFDDNTARPVVCLALMNCQTHGQSHVVPMVSHEGGIVDASTLEGYVEMVPEEDEDDFGEFDDPEDDSENLDS